MAENTISTVYRKIALVMADIGAIKPDKKHSQGYSYRSADRVFSVIQQSMIKHNLIVLSEALNADFMEEGRYLVSYRFTFVDPETADSYACSWLGEAVHTFYKLDQSGNMVGLTLNDRAINQSATNALKYFLLKTFLVSDQEPEIDDLDKPTVPAQRKNAQKSDAVGPKSISDGEKVKSPTPPPPESGTNGTSGANGSKTVEDGTIIQCDITRIEVRPIKSGPNAGSPFRKIFTTIDSIIGVEFGRDILRTRSWIDPSSETDMNVIGQRIDFMPSVPGQMIRKGDYWNLLDIVEYLAFEAQGGVMLTGSEEIPF